MSKREKRERYTQLKAKRNKAMYLHLRFLMGTGKTLRVKMEMPNVPHLEERKD